MAGHVKEFIDNCISSKVRPLVSGTSFATNITVKPHTAENMKNVPSELHSIRKLNEYETIQEPNQLTTVTMLPAKPLTLIGNISDIITHGMPPMPNEKDPVKTSIPTSAKKGLDFQS